MQHLTAAHSGELGPILDPDDRPTSDALASEIALFANGADRFDLSGTEEANLRAHIIVGVNDVVAALDLSSEETKPQMGHNRPPGPIEDQPVLATNITAAVQEIREQLGSGEPDPRAVGRAGAFLAWAGKLLEFAMLISAES